MLDSAGSSRIAARGAAGNEAGSSGAAGNGAAAGKGTAGSGADADEAARVRVLHAWDNTASGQGYLSLRRGELLQSLPPPEEPEGWGYGAVTQQYCAGCWQDLAKDVGSVGGGADRVGWFPPAFVAELEDF